MNMNIEAILSNEAFNEIDIEQKNAYINLSKKIEGKSTTETLAVLMEFAKNAPKGRPINKHEQEAMLAIVLQNMEPSEREKFKNIMSMVKMMDK